MRTINQIAKITLEKIYKKDDCIRAINFFAGSYVLDRVLDCFDTRTSAQIEAEEEFPFMGDFDSSDSGFDHSDPDKIDQLFVWGIKLGLREIPMLMGSKSIIDRVIEEEEKTCWIHNGYGFSHLVVERCVAVKNGYPIYEVDVYKVSEDQWKEIINKSQGFNIFPVTSNIYTVNVGDVEKRLILASYDSLMSNKNSDNLGSLEDLQTLYELYPEVIKKCPIVAAENWIIHGKFTYLRGDGRIKTDSSTDNLKMDSFRYLMIQQ